MAVVVVVVAVTFLPNEPTGLLQYHHLCVNCRISFVKVGVQSFI